MNAWRSHGRGTVVLRMSFRGVGRIERATGFQDPKMLGRLKEMCRTLWEQGREDILRELKRGGLSLRDVWAVYRSGDWRRMPTAAHGLPFRVMFERWMEQKVTPGYRVFAERALSAVLKIDLPETLGELPPILLRYRTACETRGHAAMWNRTRNRMRAFFRDTVTKEHQLYRDVAALAPLREQPKRAVNPQTPDEAAKVAGILGGEYGRIWWVLCCHGLMPDEFFQGKWRIEDGRLHILGTKRFARNRLVPLLAEMFTPQLAQNGFASAMRRAKLGVMPYDARRSYGLWCDLARFPEAWKKLLLGHQLSTTQGYGWRETEAALIEIEPRLKALVEPYTRGTFVGTGA